MAEPINIQILNNNLNKLDQLINKINLKLEEDSKSKNPNGYVKMWLDDEYYDKIVSHYKKSGYNILSNDFTDNLLSTFKSSRAIYIVYNNLGF